MRPLDVYDLGVRLAGQAGTEAEKRAAVGRLYYGLHLEACCRYFRENPDAAPIQRNRRHVALPDLFDSGPGQVHRGIADRLRRLASMRAECDYRIDGPLRYEGTTTTIDAMLARTQLVAAALLADLDAYSLGESTGAEARVTGV